MRDLVCAVDVGTGSARAGLFDGRGRMLARAEHPIALNTPLPDHAEHDSENIWRAICDAVREAVRMSAAGPDRVAAIGFDATCSLVVRDRDGRPLPVSDDDASCWDTIAWFDHRALDEAADCTATGHRVLDHLGGSMSPEMQMPKLMWLKHHQPQTWARAGYLFDLVDFLTWRACGTATRSRCSLTSKWTYLAHSGGWQHDFLEAIGLADILDTRGLADPPAAVGSCAGHLTDIAAAELGLDTHCRVAVGLIDAFAGALGVIGGLAEPEIEGNLALIAGTSSCVMNFSGEARHTAGIWGPYYGAVFDGYWLTEGGQSASGALLDHIVRMSGVSDPDMETHDRIIRRIAELRAVHGSRFGDDINVLPDFHGNRAPAADPHTRGVISGLTLDRSFDSQCILYWRTAVAIALGVRHILDHMSASGYRIDTLHITGGHTRNPLLMELYRDATGYRTAETTADDAVLLGTAMAAATAAGWHDTLEGACRTMQQQHTCNRADPALKSGYDRDYAVFLKMCEHRAELRAMTGTASRPIPFGRRRSG